MSPKQFMVSMRKSFYPRLRRAIRAAAALALVAGTVLALGAKAKNRAGAHPNGGAA